MAQPTLPWYQEFFREDFVKAYRNRLTEESAVREVAFVERALGLKPGQRVLDLCCGYGRHSIILVRHGLRVTGQDLSAAFLEQAKQGAEVEGLSLEVVLSDMRQIPFEEHFDAVINMFTSFGYLESEEEDVQVLHQVTKALKPGGRLLMDMINREWVVSNHVPDERHEDDDGIVYLEHREIDLVTSRSHVTLTIVLPDGTRRVSAGHHVRLYTLTETIRMLERAGLDLEHVYGGFEGEPYSLATRRMIVVARKGDS